MTHNALFIGLTTIDIQYFVEDYPQTNTKVKTMPPDILVGGPASNAAVAFAHLNGNASLASAVGVNSFTSLIRDDFNATGIEFIDIVEKQKFNPILASVITSANGERTILTHNPAVIDPSITANDLFEAGNPRLLLLDGFYPEFALECARLAQRRDIPVVIDGGSWKSAYEEILKYTDVAICSSDFFPPNCSDPEEVFMYLRKHNVKYAAISRGDKSVLYQQDQHKGDIEVAQVAVKDTLGAGDFLHGAFCYYYLESGNFVEALRKASKVASKSCCHSGTRSWLNY